MKTSKDEALQMLRNNKMYRDILASATSDSERRAIKAYTEDFLMKFYKSLYEPVTATVEKNPNAFMNEINKMHESLIKSGSIDVIMERDGRPEKPRT